MSRKIQRIKVAIGNYKYVFDVERVEALTITQGRHGNKHVSVDMDCSGIDCQPCDSYFMEDVRALASQYGYDLVNIEVKNNRER